MTHLEFFEMHWQKYCRKNSSTSGYNCIIPVSEFDTAKFAEAFEIFGEFNGFCDPYEFTYETSEVCDLGHVHNYRYQAVGFRFDPDGNSVAWSQDWQQAEWD